MFRKKQKQPVTTRSVNQSGRAPVFSYYASRSPSETLRDRGDIVRPSSGRLKNIFGYLPSIVAGTALIGCLIYVSTLTTDANVQVVAHTPRDQTLLTNLDTYKSELTAILSSSPLNRSKLLIDTDAIAQQLSEEFPELGDISVVLPLVGRRPVLKVRPAEPAVTLSAAGGPYVVDTRGRVLAYTRNTDSQITDNLPTVRDESGLPADPGSAVITDSTIDFVETIVGQLSHADVRIESLTLPQTSAGELHIRPEGKPYFVKMDMRGKGRMQAGTYLAVKRHLESEGKTPAEYIDVRVPEKAFYK